jgi:hypothetical protein
MEARLNVTESIGTGWFTIDGYELRNTREYIAITVDIP